MIVSVPHSGSRSLVELLGVAHLYHFGQNESRWLSRKEHIDFPVRDPLAISLSWRSHGVNRLQGRIGNNPHYDEFPRIERAIEYLQDYEYGWTPHVMENLPVLSGESSMSWYKQAYQERDLKPLLELPETRILLEWYPRVERFFSPFYGTFWWQHA